MKIHWTLSAKQVLDPAQSRHILSLFRNAGVNHINLFGYFWGCYESPVDQLARAKNLLLQEGFSTGIASMAVGHPGNSVDPDNPTVDLRLPKHWRYRVDRHGRDVLHCADIEENMIRDNIEAIKQFQKAGFKFAWFDDDTRQGNWGNEIQGCFCDVCIAQFNEISHHHETRQSLGRAIVKRKDLPLLKDWVQFTCDKVTRFVTAMAIGGMDIGVMVMHRGDERHGIDINAWKKLVPNIHLRVGEAHFNDREFNPPTGKASELLGMLQHLNLMPLERTYTETTTFPPRNLTPDNWVYKAKMGLALGIPNVYLMNGYATTQEDYWAYFQAKLPELRAIDEQCGKYMRSYPVHIACGTHGALGETIQIPALPFLAGLPVKPVRAAEAGIPGEILIILGKFKVGPEWLVQLPAYKHIIADKAAINYNPKILRKEFVPSLQLVQSEKLERMHSPRDRFLQSVTNLRQVITSLDLNFPYLQAGMNIAIVWVDAAHKVILFNLEDEPNHTLLHYHGRSTKIQFQTKEFKIITLKHGNGNPT